MGKNKKSNTAASLTIPHGQAMKVHSEEDYLKYNKYVHKPDQYNQIQFNQNS